MTDSPDLNDRIAEMFRESETEFAKLTEQLVQRDGFGEILAWTTENVMAVTKLAFDVGDSIVRGLRLAGRKDINRLAHQLARTEDKIEMLLQEVEALRAENRSVPGADEPQG